MPPTVTPDPRSIVLRPLPPSLKVAVLPAPGTGDTVQFVVVDQRASGPAPVHVALSARAEVTRTSAAMKMDAA